MRLAIAPNQLVPMSSKYFDAAFCTASANAESIQSLTFDLQPGTYAVSFGVVDSFSWQASYLQREVTILSAK